MTKFEEGVFYSICLLVEDFCGINQAVELVKEAGLVGMDVCTLCEEEKVSLRKLCEWDSSLYFDGL